MEKGKIIVIAAHIVDSSLEDLFDEIILMGMEKLCKGM